MNIPSIDRPTSQGLVKITGLSTNPFVDFASASGDFAGGEQGIHVNALTDPGAILIEGDGASLYLGDRNGGANDKIFQWEVNGGVLTGRSLNDDLTTLKDNAFVVNLVTGFVGIGTSLPGVPLHIPTTDTPAIQVGDGSTGHIKVGSVGIDVFNPGILTLNNTTLAMIKGTSGLTQTIGLHLNNNGVLDGGNSLTFKQNTDTGSNKITSEIGGILTDTGDATYSGALVFNTLTGGGSLTERVRIAGNGNIGINETAPQDKLEVNGTVLVKGKLIFTQDDRDEYIDSEADEELTVAATTAINLKIGGTQKLSVVTGGTLIGSGEAGVDYVLGFIGENNNGFIAWMEDEDYFKFNDDLVLDKGVLFLKETTTPTDIADHGSVYFKSDNKFYVQTGDGVEHEIAFV